MAYVYPPLPPRWPVGRGPFEVKRPDAQRRMVFGPEAAVIGRSRMRYTVSSQKPYGGWSLHVVVPVSLDLWLSYIHDERSKTRLVQEFYRGRFTTLVDRDRVLGDFGLRSTLTVSNV